MVIHPIVKPLNRVIKSPNHSYEFFLNKNKPPNISPRPAPNSHMLQTTILKMVDHKLAHLLI